MHILDAQQTDFRKVLSKAKGSPGQKGIYTISHKIQRSVLCTTRAIRSTDINAVSSTKQRVPSTNRVKTTIYTDTPTIRSVLCTTSPATNH